MENFGGDCETFLDGKYMSEEETDRENDDGQAVTLFNVCESWRSEKVSKNYVIKST